MGARIAIVGAGPTGLALALMTQAFGHEVIIYEASPRPDLRPRAVMLHARALEILQTLGLVDTLMPHGLMTREIAFLRDDGLRFSMDFSRIASPFQGILNIRQPVIEAVLADAFLQRGGVIERGCTIVNLRQIASGVEIELRNASNTIVATRADWLFGCDGAHSSVRTLIDARFEGATLAHNYILGEGRPEMLGAPAVSCMLISDAGVISWLPFEDGTVRVAGPGLGISAGDIPQALESETTAHFLLEQKKLIADPRYRIGRVERTARYRVHSRIASHWGRERVWLAGDAAHVHPPAGGQALNLGLSDAESIAMRLSGLTPLAFDSYEIERRPITKATLDEVAMMPLVARMRACASDDEVGRIIKELDTKAHRLSQVDTDISISGPECLGTPDDQTWRVGRRVSALRATTTVHPHPHGWRTIEASGRTFWMLQDRHVRRIS